MVTLPLILCPGEAWARRMDRAELRRLQNRSRSGEAERDARVLAEERERAQRESYAAQMATLDAYRREHPQVANVFARAERYLETLARDGASHESLRRAALALVRGFALAEDEALGVLTRGWPAKVSRAELLRQVRGAARSDSVGLGYLLR